MKHRVLIKDAVKQYGDFTAVNGVNLDIQPGEFFTLLGPSGCGKTTLLRMIAGFNSVEGGEFYFDDKLINNVDAHKRDIGMVFQNYAIFPHLTVEENVAYGLKAKKVPKQEIGRRVEEALKLVQIEKLKDRKPNELSGGQQQRVALARAFVIEPSVLLMDEPLSNLDAKLRVQMRTVIKKLQRQLGITTIYVTHDQEEALAISDRIAVMQNGNIMQVGTPEEIYKKPKNMFVAGFIGVTNFIDCEIKNNDFENTVAILNDEFSLKISLKNPYSGKAKISARPEQIYFSESTGLKGRITLATFLGDYIEYEIELFSGQTLQVNEYTKDVHFVRPINQEVLINFNSNEINAYAIKSGEVITC